MPAKIRIIGSVLMSAMLLITGFASAQT